jgi:nicotinamide-nucleotide amidase
MIVEVIAVGTELLLGQIVNSNAAAIGARLADEGFDAHYQVTVGDNLDRLGAAIRTALGRADAVILTGGIGPTQDDLTKDALGLVTGQAMTRDEAHAERIRALVAASGGPAVSSALRMADYPSGAQSLPNRNGTALGVAMKHDGKLLFAVPGVPREMTVMLDEQVLPRLRAAVDAPTVLRSRVIKTWGHGEAHIADLLGDLYELTNPSLAYLIDETEVRVRISAKADHEAAALALIAPLQQEVERRLAGCVFGYDDDTGIGVLGRALRDHGWTLAVAEAATAGLVASRLAGSAQAPFAGGITLPAGSTVDAVALARQAGQQFSALVSVGVGAVETDPIDAPTATVVPVAVITPDAVSEMTLRLFGDGERARAHAASATVHVARLAVTGRDLPESSLWARPRASGGR